MDIRIDNLIAVNVLGNIAYFSNHKIPKEELPKGFYEYDLKEGQGEIFVIIEPNIITDYAGSIITKTPIEFNSSGCISLALKDFNTLGFCERLINLQRCAANQN